MVFKLIKKALHPEQEVQPPKREDYPSGPEGDAIWQAIENGVSPKEPVDIDFYVAFPDKEKGKQFEELVNEHGYDACADQADKSDGYTSSCTKTVDLDHTAITAEQRKIDQLAKPFEGKTDSWDTVSK